MKKLLSLLLVLALLLPFCTGYAAEENYGELYIDWQPDSLGDDPDAPEYDNVYIDPDEDEGSGEDSAWEEDSQDSGEIDWSEYAVAAMDLDGDEESAVSVTKPSTRLANSDSPTASDSHYYTPEAFDVPVSDQGSDSICWAVSAVDSLMIGAKKDKISIGTLSPEALVYYTYHGFTDSLCNRGRDYITPEYRSANVYASLMTLASWVGASAAAPDKTTDLISYAGNELWLENGYWLRLSGSMDRAAVREAILAYGSVTASLYMVTSGSYYNDGTNAYYFSGTASGTNHQIVIVGWDDSYSADNFASKPAGDGAWLCRNSWGANWGDCGYFWLSYYDTALCSKGIALALDAGSWGADKNLYQYDCSYALYKCETIDAGSVTIANVYTAGAGDSELLCAVGTYAAAPNTQYTATIYTDLEDGSDPSSGYPIASVSGKFDYAGYQSVRLSGLPYLEAGEKFSVVIELSFPETSGNKLPICVSNTGTVGSVSFTTYNSANDGESFRLDGTDWTDRSAKAGGGVNYRIKAYTVSVDAAHEHSWATDSTPVPATCTEDGISLEKCSDCMALRTAVIPPTGHTPTEIPAVAATCTAKGKTAGERCSVCGTILTAQEETDALGHTWNAGEVTTDPSCTAKGVRTYTCSVCGETRTEDIAPTGHTPTRVEAAAPTAVAAGNIEHWKCSRCGGYFADEACTRPLDADAVFTPALGFSDVEAGSYYEAAVLWAADEGVTVGASAMTFEPKTRCSRAQIVTFLWRAAGEPEPEGAECPFLDVREGSYYYKAVLWAAEKGIAAGTTAASFEPERVCSRGQIVTFLWRYFGAPEPEGASARFTDVPSEFYYYKAVLWAVENNVTAGTDSTRFSPNLSCTRAQAVTFLCRADSLGK